MKILILFLVITSNVFALLPGEVKLNAWKTKNWSAENLGKTKIELLGIAAIDIKQDIYSPARGLYLKGKIENNSPEKIEAFIIKLSISNKKSGKEVLSKIILFEYPCFKNSESNIAKIFSGDDLVAGELKDAIGSLGEGNWAWSYTVIAVIPELYWTDYAYTAGYQDYLMGYFGEYTRFKAISGQ
jgi:hypothetical protein